MSLVIEIDDYASEQDFISRHPTSVIFFGSRGCGHCKSIKPKFEQLASTYKQIGFGHVETGTAQGPIEQLQGVPTFQFYRQGEPYDNVLGARLDTITDILEQLS